MASYTAHKRGMGYRPQTSFPYRTPSSWTASGTSTEYGDRTTVRPATAATRSTTGGSPGSPAGWTQSASARKPRPPTYQQHSKPKVVSAEERAETAEKLSLDLARRLREAELRAEQAEQKRAEADDMLAGMRSYICLRFDVEHGLVEDGTDRYEGFLDKLQPTLWGVCKYGNNDVYEGEWKEGKPDGHGTCKFAGGNSYSGMWMKGGYHGHGIYRYACGDKFEGTWEDDNRNGHGLFTESNGTEWVELYEQGTLQARYPRKGWEERARSEQTNGSAKSAGAEKPKTTPRSGSAPSGGRESAAGAGANAGTNARTNARASTSGRTGAPPPKPNGARYTSYSQMKQESYENHAEAWSIFELRDPALPIHFNDVPWPPMGKLIPPGTQEMQRKKQKELARRWHPDKWQGKPLVAADRERVMEKVTSLFQRAEEEKKSLGL